MEIDFRHRQSAHCESGVAANILSHHGVEISEAMAFGIGAGLFFGYLPFIRPNNLPLTTFRAATGGIFKSVTRRLGVSVKTKRFRSPEKAMAALDEKLSEGIPVGLQTGVFWLPYFPPAYRFHFNAHNLIAFGKEGDDYRVSDPLFEESVLCAADGLERARFAKGPLAPKGKMYWLSQVPDSVTLTKPALSGIKAACNAMLKPPMPIIGIRGIRFMAGRMEKWEENLGREAAILHLGQLIRMQEEIGTGGAGFRFIYAAFLQEMAAHTGEEAFSDLSLRMTAIGDQWRLFAAKASRFCKGRGRSGEGMGFMADIIRECADLEKGLYIDLNDLARSMD